MAHLNIPVVNPDTLPGGPSNTSLLENTSYSMMHSLVDGFSIILYLGTHKGLSKDKHHRNDAVRLVLGNDMVVLWHEGLLHSGARSRAMTTDGTGISEAIRKDLRLFSYVWPTKPSGTRNGRGRIRVNDGNNIHRLKNHL